MSEQHESDRLKRWWCRLTLLGGIYSNQLRFWQMRRSKDESRKERKPQHYFYAHWFSADAPRGIAYLSGLGEGEQTALVHHVNESRAQHVPSEGFVMIAHVKGEWEEITGKYAVTTIMPKQTSLYSMPWDPLKIVRSWANMRLSDICMEHHVSCAMRVLTGQQLWEWQNCKNNDKCYSSYSDMKDDTVAWHISAKFLLPKPVSISGEVCGPSASFDWARTQ